MLVAKPPVKVEQRVRQANAHTHRRYNQIASLSDLLEEPIELLYYQRWRRRLWDMVQGPMVMEIGIGTGKNIPYYPDGVMVMGIDKSENMLHYAWRLLTRHDGKAVVLHLMDAQDLRFEDDTFDEVVATFVFCSVPDPIQGLLEARRVTRPGGRLLLLEHMRAASPRLTRLMQGLDPFVHWLTGIHMARDLIAKVATAGWMVDRVTPVSKTAIYRLIVAYNPALP